MNRVITSLITVLLVVFVMLMGVPFMQGLFVDWNVQNAISYLEDNFNYIVLGSGSQVPDSLVPSKDNTYDLGTAASRWRNLFLGGTATLPTISGVASFSASSDLDIGDHDFRAQTFTSDIATGTAPFTVNSTTTVTNLSADLVDGYQMARTATYVVAASDSSPQSKAQADYVCDGIDDQVEIQAAIDALPADGGRVLLSEGTFNAKRIQVIDRNNITLEGQGVNTILVMPVLTQAEADAGGENIYFLRSSNSRVANLKVDNNGRNQTALDTPGLYYYIGVRFEGSTDSVIENIWTYDCIGGGVYLDAYGATKSERISIHNLYGNKNGVSHPIQERGTLHLEEVSYITVNDLFDLDSKELLDLTASSHISVNNAHSDTAALRAIDISDSTDIQMNNIIIESAREGVKIAGDNSRWVMDNIIIHGTTGDFYSLWFTDGTDTDMSFSNLQILGAVRGIASTSSPLATLKRVLFSNCIIKDISGAWGAYFAGPLIDSAFVNSHFEHTNGAGLALYHASNSNVSIIGSVARDCNVNGFIISDGSGFRIIGNRAYDTTDPYTQDYGIYLYKPTNVVVRGNDLRGNNTAPLRYGDDFDPTASVIYERYSDLFMDVLAADLDHIHALVAYDALAHTDVTSPDVPRNASASLYNSTAGALDTLECTATITGVDARGNSITEVITIPAVVGLAAGAYTTVYGSKAFATVSQIQFSDVAQPTGIQMCAGISDKLGLSNVIYATGDVYKVKKNNADIAVGAVDVTNGTVDCATITGGDDFTIYYKSNLNIVS
jgi:hypothetical protein